MREEMRLYPWIADQKEWKDYLDELVVIARLMDYEIEYRWWAYEQDSSCKDDAEEGEAWYIKMSRGEEMRMLVFNFVDKKFRRIFIRKNKETIEGRRSDKIKRMKQQLLEWL